MCFEGHDAAKSLVAQMARLCGVANSTRTKARLLSPARNYGFDEAYKDSEIEGRWTEDRRQNKEDIYFASYVCRRVALIALLWRFRMPLKAALVLASSDICAPLLSPSASEFLYYLPFAPLCGYCPFFLAFISSLLA